MTKRTNRGRLPNPDLRGYVRPEVGGKRFIVGNIKDVGTSEMERRLADLRNLFERQCQYHEIDHWAGPMEKLHCQQWQPNVIVGSSRGGAVAINIKSENTPMILLCPAWKNWGTATTVKPKTIILHSRQDDVIRFADSEELVTNSGLPTETFIEVGNDHRLADRRERARHQVVVAAFKSE